MNWKRITFSYLIGYLAIGGLGFMLLPEVTLKLFLSTGDYGDIMPRFVGTFMCIVSFLLYNIYKNEDWKYYPVTIYARTPLVLFMGYIYYVSRDLLFLMLIGIVSVGLIPSFVVYFRQKKSNG
ncbi:hypothetical protein QQ008_22300 [Fulvivirgaceae bacterium BMA10]|uniref:Uncharacterized protein n=1 Tax=Splendidivirga corallicola TaxID=3051826 RepID=A0ABT8KTN7_9BACT|nr:hypothetical protein [Fulvivirgaceae bacterium BMA10]